jgi:hypothetical protein
LAGAAFAGAAFATGAAFAAGAAFARVFAGATTSVTAAAGASFAAARPRAAGAFASGSIVVSLFVRVAICEHPSFVSSGVLIYFVVAVPAAQILFAMHPAGINLDGGDIQINKLQINKHCRHN